MKNRRIKRSAQLARTEPTSGQEWYCVDPMKGSAVVRAEFFYLPAHAATGPELPPERQGTCMEDSERSPQGFGQRIPGARAWPPLHRTTA